MNGINNPCPIGYRIPTSAELDNERLSWSSNDPTGAFASVLKLTLSGGRIGGVGGGNISGTETIGSYWSSITDNTGANSLRFETSANIATGARSRGNAIRCIKN